jgi:hypothetical protein
MPTPVVGAQDGRTRKTLGPSQARSSTLEASAARLSSSGPARVSLPYALFEAGELVADRQHLAHEIGGCRLGCWSGGIGHGQA